MTTSQDMVIIHRVFRRELALLPPLIRSVAPEEAERRDRLASHLVLVLDVLDHHHEGEDLLLWPRLRERAAEANALLDEMAGDHARLHRLLTDTRSAAGRWRTSAEPGAASELADAVAALGTALMPHLDREEVEVLTLVDRLLTQDEWNELGGRAFSLLPPDDAMIVLAQMGEESPAEEWAAFMTHLPPPVQDAYTASALPAYPGYVAAIRHA